MVALRTWRKASRLISKLGVIVGGLSVVAGVLSLFIKRLDIHMAVMLYGGLILFPHSVAIAYISSSAKKRGIMLTAVMSVFTIPMLATPVIAYWDPYKIPIILLLVPGILSIIAAIVSGFERKGSLTLSMIMTGLTYVSLIAVLLYWLSRDTPINIVTYALSLTLAYPVPLIYAVTVHSLPSTFRDKPNAAGALATWALNTFGLLYLLCKRDVYLAADFVLAGSLVYIWAARLARTGRYLRMAYEMSRGNRIVYSGLKYYLVGHIFVIIQVGITGALLAYNMLERGVAGLGLELLLLHLYALGFSWMHVAIHAPMMLPVILGLKHATRYNNVPYVTALLGVLLWPFNGLIAGIMIILSFIGMVGVFLRV